MAVKKTTKTAAKSKKPATKSRSTVTDKPATKKPVKSKLADIKTKPTSVSVTDFINGVKEEQKRKDAFTILEMMKKASKEEPKMWGSSIIGFGDKRYKSPATGREVDWFKIGFSPRKANLTIYLIMNMKEYTAQLKKLGKHKLGGGCLYINKLADIDVKILKEIMDDSLKKK